LKIALIAGLRVFNCRSLYLLNSLVKQHCLGMPANEEMYGHPRLEVSHYAH
jgi:hypothetical protein